jgi:hypothetical protein
MPVKRRQPVVPDHRRCGFWVAHHCAITSCGAGGGGSADDGAGDGDGGSGVTMTIGTVGGGNRETVPVKVTSATAPAMPQRIRCLGADGSGSGSDGGGNSSGDSSGGLGMPGSTKTPGANCSVDDFAIGEVLPGPAVDSCQTLTQACDLDDNPGSDEMSVRSRFLAVH